MDRSCLAKRRQQQGMEFRPHGESSPIGKPSPASAAAAAAHLDRQILPRNTRFEHEHDPGQRRPMLDTRTTAFGRPGRQGRQQWFDLVPQCIRHKFRHAYASLLYATAE
jgi:hypothetical protein